MLIGILILMLCQLLGELLMTTLGIPVPGPVAGMVILLIGLMAYGGVPEGLRVPAEALIRNLSLLFIPAGVGLMVHFKLLADFWLLVAVALIASTLLTLLITAWLMQRMHRNASGDGNADH